MRPRDVFDALVALIPTRRPLFLWGKPATAKTALVHQAGARLGLPVLVRRLGYEDPVDGRGLPSIKDGRTIWNRPALLPLEGKGILFLDELPQAAPAMQQVGAQIALERRCGEHPLGDGWFVLAAGNRQEDRAGTHKMPTNVESRFMHLDVDVCLEDWMARAIEDNIHVAVRSFMNFKPSLLHKFDPSLHERAFPNYRSWYAVSDALAVTPEGILLDVLAGTVGKGAAAEFLSFLQVYQGLPARDAILASPLTTQVPTQTSVLYALCGAMAEWLRGSDQYLLPVAQYITRFPDEFALLALRDGGRVNPALVDCPPVVAWFKSHKYLTQKTR